ncbi:site-specific integrase [Pseudoflavonifractor sp. An85]|uniref:site-specific integrase n=1 Tax=Pseudoflavonifractor sp. An85 TaxID=1965661 RepID=UPI000B3A08AB|nr:site-specific integrase [Pseudoflavonifractor sp. An85]OUN24561.1 hypothetical protein B5G37_07165 [Pseudoflavonifractor sp. An85]
MKLPTPKKLPSGNWNVVVMVGGRRISITEPTEKKALAAAAAVKAGAKREKQIPLTVGDAINRYIESKDAVLSPATVAGYRRIRANAFQELMPIHVSSLTQEQVQRAVNSMAKTKSSKSVRNAHGLLSATLATYRPDFTLHTTLPQKQKAEISIPTPEHIQVILSGCSGTRMELPIYLAVWLGLRASEIRGLTWDCISGDTLHVKQAIVEGDHGPAVKGTKTTAGDRRLHLPPQLLEIIQRQPKTDEYLVHLSGQAMYKAFSRLCEKLGLPHYRFHDLRHANASIMLALGIPNRYAQERMGHATDNMLKAVYQHTMEHKRTEVDTAVDTYFSHLLQTKLQTQN